jgi:hypothetical protein
MERRKILIATKTYPSISRKYRETVCTAGLLLDEEDNPSQWIRIYPIKFRELEFDRRYPRWSIISAEIERNDKDFRHESFRINDSSIEIIRKIGTQEGWKERKTLLLPFLSPSITDIQERGASLGLIKPTRIVRYFSRSTEREWSPKQQAILDQSDLFEASTNLEKIPYQFGYEFITSNNKKHKMTISDWEISELYRKCKNQSKALALNDKEQEGLEKVRQKLEDDFMQKKDLYFIVGNLKNHCKTFMIIGLFYPPMQRKTEEVVNLSLFDF